MDFLSGPSHLHLMTVVLKLLMSALGVVLMAVGVVITPLPGPFGVPVILLGLIILLRSSMWVKRLFVKPGKRLSLQKHHHRSEHWVVVRGTAEVTVDGNVSMLSENQSVYLPLGCTHRLANPGKILLELIEVQTGSYLGEDDIVRIEDEFGRA